MSTYRINPYWDGCTSSTYNINGITIHKTTIPKPKKINWRKRYEE